MTYEEFTEELNKNIVNIINPKVYIEIIRKDNNLSRFDIMNKIAICTMTNGESLYDLKTAEEWMLCNRKVIDKSKKIYVAIPKYDKCYIDSETLARIDISEFTQEELKKAIELKIVKKEQNIRSIDVVTVYDIRNTSKIDKNIEYNVVKPKISIDALVNIMKNYMKLDIVIGEDSTYYSKSSGKLFIAKNTYEIMIQELVDILIKHVLDDRLQDYIKGYINNTERKFNKLELELLKESLRFAILSVFKVSDESRLLFELRKNYVNDYEDIIDIITICDAITFDICSFLEYTDGSNMKDAVSNIELIRKSENLLNILQANSILNKMKGV